MKLKPCPFCGSDAKIIPIVSSHYIIECTNCPANLSILSPKKRAIETWNRRTLFSCATGEYGSSEDYELKRGVE